MSETSPGVHVPAGFDPVPSIDRSAAVKVSVADAALGGSSLDVSAGTAQGIADESWRTAGRTGFGARLLVEMVVAFRRPAA